MTIKEIIAIASDDKIMFMLETLNESLKNDYRRTIYEVKTEEKERKIMAKRIKDLLAK